MSDRKILRKSFLEIVDDQLRLGQPPETQATLDRLISEGHSRQEARRLIAAVAATEVWHVLHDRGPFNEARHVAALRRLPALPEDE